MRGGSDAIPRGAHGGDSGTSVSCRWRCPTASGSETQRPFAVVIVGGLVTTALVTFLLLPVLYTLVAGRKVPVRMSDEELEAAEAGADRPAPGAAE